MQSIRRLNPIHPSLFKFSSSLYRSQSTASFTTPPASLTNKNAQTTMATEKSWTVESAIPPHIKEALAAELTSSSSSNFVMSFLQIVSLLKIQRRTGWLDHGIEDCESIADHMYRMAVTAMLIKDRTVDTNRCVKIAIVHDIAESLVGDITPFDVVGKDEKHRREFETIKFLSELVSKYDAERGEEILECWLDYEEIRTREARYVKDIDKFELLMQCFEYEKRFAGAQRFDQFWDARKAIKTEEVTQWSDDLWAKRSAFWKEIDEKKQ